MSPFIFPYSGSNRLKYIFVKAKRYKLEQGGYALFMTAEGPLFWKFNHMWLEGLEVLTKRYHLIQLPCPHLHFYRNSSPTYPSPLFQTLTF